VTDPSVVDGLLDTLPCGVVSFGDDGRIVYANGTFGTMLGSNASELAGRHVETLLMVSGRIFYQTHFFPLLRLHGKVEEVFLLFRRADGTELGALVNAARRTRGGTTVNDCVLIEVRERRKYEDELLRARREAEKANAQLVEQARELERQHEQLQEQAAELEAQGEEMKMLNDELTTHAEELERARLVADEANRAKSEFLAVMSHELRTPLNAIGGYVQLIELGIHGPVTDAQRETLERVTRSQQHLLRLINDLLNLARIEARHVEYRVQDVRIADALSEVVPMVEPQLVAAGLRLDSSVDADVIARADAEKVQQILLNLLNNAVKFTPAGGRVAVETSRDDRGRVRVSVVDSGIGIKPEKLESIFEPFVQLRERRSEGTGLGLAISRDLARGMGGELEASSEVGRGSRFTLTLPASGGEAA
jgi:PAS domain S-box-containing protein